MTPASHFTCPEQHFSKFSLMTVCFCNQFGETLLIMEGLDLLTLCIIAVLFQLNSLQLRACVFPKFHSGSLMTSQFDFVMCYLHVPCVCQKSRSSCFDHQCSLYMDVRLLQTLFKLSTLSNCTSCRGFMNERIIS